MAEIIPPATQDRDGNAPTGQGKSRNDPQEDRQSKPSRRRRGGKNTKSRGRSTKPRADAKSDRNRGQDTREQGHRDQTGDKVEARKPAPQPVARQSPTPRHAAGPRQSYAAIDLGTNNCRLLIARPSGENFVVIDAFSRVVRLGEGLAQTGRLSDAAMDRTLGALRICSEKLRRRNVHLARSVATEACRRAENGDEFIRRVREETGIALNIISAREEARLAVLGCHVLLEQGEGPAMIFDIGGGSTELVLVETGDAVPSILDWQSVPWGVVSLTESFPALDTESDHDRIARYRAMRAAVHDSFRDFHKRLEPFREMPTATAAPRLLGTSGTVTTLASVHLGLPQYDRRAVDGLIVPARSMREIADMLSVASPDRRQQLPCIGNERAELVVAGCAILETILDLWPADRLGVADRGIREGILRSLMAPSPLHVRPPIGRAARPL